MRVSVFTLRKKVLHTFFVKRDWSMFFLVKRDFLFTRDSGLVIPQTTHSKKEKNEMKKIDEKVDCGLKNKKKEDKVVYKFSNTEASLTPP